MARRGIKKKDYEKLDDATLGRVVALLEDSKPITKKAACEALNINYSTSRLARIIEEYKDKIAFQETRKKQMKGKPFSDMDTQDMVISYLSGESVSTIAKRLYRSTNVINTHLKKLNLPSRDKATDYTKPKLMPDEMVAEEFDPKEYAWSAKYNCVVQIIKDYGILNNGEGFDYRVYCIYIFGKFMEFGYQPVYELGKLEVLKQFTIREDDFSTEQNFNYSIG